MGAPVAPRASFAFAIGVALLIGVAARVRRLPAGRTALLVAVVLVSHPLLEQLPHQRRPGLRAVLAVRQHALFRPVDPDSRLANGLAYVSRPFTE